MSPQTAPEPDAVKDLSEPAEYAHERTLPNPTAAETAKAWVRLTVPTVAVNIVLYAIATAAGASMVADLGPDSVSIGWVSIAIATSLALLSSTVVWAAVAHRSPGFADLWVWLGWGVGLVSLSMILGVSDASTGVTLASMHALTTLVAANVLPRVLPRFARST